MPGEVLPYSFDKVWFMDCFGHVLCYTPHRKALARVPLQGAFVSGFVASPYPFPQNFVPQWRNIFNMMVELAPLRICPQDRGLVALCSEETGDYLSINPSNNKTTFAGGIADWELFCPLPYDVYMGLLAITDPGVSHIVCHNDNAEISGLQFLSPGENKPFVASLDRKRISFLDNLDNFAKIGRMKKGDMATFAFAGFVSDKQYNIRIKRLKDIAF
ncbi:hypothetical protein CPA57_00300 [Bombella sp. TMW2.1880]|uniref:Uncharacterized protein n=2 Tax=Bombella favorum TaxID=2039164 RepID=A0ABR5ZK84_9PROT|nr:hypothetical protein [Bombella favorum]